MDTTSTTPAKFAKHLPVDFDGETGALRLDRLRLSAGRVTDGNGRLFYLGYEVEHVTRDAVDSDVSWDREAREDYWFAEDYNTDRLGDMQAGTWRELKAALDAAEAARPAPRKVFGA